MRKFLIAFEILAYLALSAVFAFGLVPMEKYTVAIADKIGIAVILIVFLTLFLLSASASKNYFSFRTPFISFFVLIACFSLNSFDIFISNDLFCITVFSLALVIFASKGEKKIFLSSLTSFVIAVFAFVFYEKEAIPTNLFFVSFSLIAAIFAFVSAHFNNKMEIFKRESILKLRIANKIQNINKGEA